VGAAVFDALESETERKRWNHLLGINQLFMNYININLQVDCRLNHDVKLK